MAFLLGVFEGDFDPFKAQFDADPLGRRQLARGHTIMRGVENPSEFFVRVEFESVEAAKAFRDKVLASPVLDNVNVKVGPTVAELVDQDTY
jgi:hypothetical protein